MLLSYHGCLNHLQLRMSMQIRHAGDIAYRRKWPPKEADLARSMPSPCKAVIHFQSAVQSAVVAILECTRIHDQKPFA